MKSTFLAFGLLSSLLLLGTVMPLGDLFLHASWNEWTALTTTPAARQALETSVLASAVALLFMTLTGVPLGYVLARAPLPAKRFWISLVFLPLVVPDLAGGILLLQTFGPYGAIGQWLDGKGVELTNNFIGIVLSELFVASPFVVISSLAAFSSVDPKLEWAAATLGDSQWQIFRRVALPLAWPGVSAGLTLAWIRALGEFGTTLIMAYNPHTLSVYMWVKFESEGLAGAMPVALCLVLLAVAALALSTLLNPVAGYPGITTPLRGRTEG